MNRRKKHHLSDIFFITLCATICGADIWVAIERFEQAKKAWFTEQLDLEHGIPSHDTFGDIFAAIDTEQFSQCFSNWAVNLATFVEEGIIALDGKCLRRSIDKASNKAAIYMISAWSRQNSLVLGQVKVDDATINKCINFMPFPYNIELMLRKLPSQNIS